MKEKTAYLGALLLGEGMPAICVPLMGRTVEEISDAAARAKAAGADVMELRIDAMSAMPDLGMAVAACEAAKKEAGEIPLLFTLRTARDGGGGAADKGAYEALLCGMAKSGACEGIDCELSVGEDAFARIAQTAHAHGVTLVGSSHEFGEIGDGMRAAQWLYRQEALGADVCKAAVMVSSRAQALEMAHIFAKAHERLRIPMIAIAMGPEGALTRLAAGTIGSCLTFGTAGASSAPGQIDARTLRTALEIMEDAMR